MIAQRKAISVYLDSVLDEAIALFTTELSNGDASLGEESTVVSDIERWMDEEKGKGGRNAEADSITYTVLAVLVAFYLLIRQSQKVSLAGVLQVLLFELTPEQRVRLGMTGDLTVTRAHDIARASDPSATPAEQLAGRQARDREYARLAKFTAAVFAGFDPSPFHKSDTLTRPEKVVAKAERAKEKATAIQARKEGKKYARKVDTGRRSRVKMTNAQRQAILADPHHPDRRIDTSTSERNYDRLLDVMNKVVAAAAKTAPAEGWVGDVATDETVVITLPTRWRHGTRDEFLTSSDPDAYYWPGKSAGKDGDADGADSGFGYGITFVVRVGRPYERRIPEVALGIHIGKPTGGTTEAVRAALKRAERHDLLKDSRQRRLIADRGYTTKDDWMPFLVEEGYVPVQDYAANWLQDIPIGDVDAEGQPALNGPRLIGGRIRCPGAQGLTEKQMVRPHDDKLGDETDDEILTRYENVRRLDALAMPVKRGLAPVGVEATSPNAHQVPDHWSITVECPARANKVNCDLYQRPEGARDRKLPDVQNHPVVSDAGLLPRACRQEHVTYHLPLTHAKRLQPLTWGSHGWADAYKPVRSSNERYHSQFKHGSSGGVRESWLEMRGVAKHGLLAAIASAVTTEHLIGDFRTKHVQADGQATFGPREAMRRHRYRITHPRTTKS